MGPVQISGPTGTVHFNFSVKQNSNPQPPSIMLRWSLIFFVIGLIAALLGFTSIAGTAIGIAKIIFYVFAVLFLVTLLAGLMSSNDRLTK